MADSCRRAAHVRRAPMSLSNAQRVGAHARSGWRGWLAAVAAAIVLAPGAAAAADVGAVRGVVHDAGHRPIAGAAVVLRSKTADWSLSSHSSAAGEFAFPAVPVGDYVLSIRQSGFATTALPLTVVSGAAPSTHVQLLSGAPEETVTVSAAAPGTADSFTPTTLVDREDIARTPGADRTDSLAMITDFMPGAYFVHDQLHVRGGHQVSWEIDGVEIPNTNIASNLGPQIDPKNIDYLEAQGGSYGADEGDRTYGVFNVVPRTGFERNSEGELVASGGNYGQTNDELSVGDHTDNFAYYGSVNGNRSDLGLMTPVESIIHDAQDGYGAFTSLIYNDRPTISCALVASARHDDYQIPNTPGQLAEDVQREADDFAILTWVHTFSSQAMMSSSLLLSLQPRRLRRRPAGLSDQHHLSALLELLGGQEALRGASATTSWRRACSDSIRPTISSSTCCSTTAATRRCSRRSGRTATWKPPTPRTPRRRHRG